MKSVLILLAAIFVLAQASGVTVLTPDNWKSVMDGSKAAFVEFYAPWCGHCKHLEPEYEKVGEAFADSKDVLIAKVDADAHRELGEQFGVQGFPTLKFFPKGWKSGDETTPYEEGRTADSIIEFVKANSGAKAKKAKTLPSNVVELNNKNFNEIVLDKSKDVLVEFYAPWCGHCKRLVPDYEKVSGIFKGDKHVVIAKIDADAAPNKELAAKYGVTGFPTLKWFPKGGDKEAKEYNAGRDVASFVKFINENAGTHRTASGSLDDNAGRVSSLDSLASNFASGDKTALLKEATAAVAGLSGDDATNGKVYLRYMEKISSEGKTFVTNELARLVRLIESPSTAPGKIDEFTVRKNILSAFNN